MPKIPFKVSARTARLIGRENIASSKGAIVELVKNCYDADSSISLIYFNKQNDELYIIDSGEGMTQKIILEHWMTIGTDNKANNVFTSSGRVRAGAKGIGRFALDKLGDKCEMTTKFNPKVHEDIDENNINTTNEAYLWEVNWKDFEGDFKTIDQIEANLIGLEELDLKSMILDEIKDNRVRNVINNFSFDYGTVLKITNLRDNWEDFYIEQVYNDLEVLVPPRESSSFRLFLFSSENKEKYGEILGSICDDYDYKVVAKADDKQNVEIKIYRNEYDIETINPKLFERKTFQNYPFRKKDFQKGYWSIEKTFSELIEGFSKIDKDDTFSKIGNFDFTFYFMKRTYSTPDLKKFFYREFVSRDRKDWLNKFGGIKLFRDEFRVRPYGEVNDSAFDWLGLGSRKAASPAPTTHKSGKWKVEPDNVAGAINITRISNLDFQDKSSREGLQENKTFQIFKRIILRILDIFEDDRAKIAREMKLFYDELNFDKNQKEYVENLTKKILEEALKNKENSDSDNNKKENDDIDNDKLLLAESIKEKEEEIETLKEEQKLLRGMASSGIVMASFSHDLSKLSHNLSSRIDKLKKILLNEIKEESYNEIENRKNPFYILDRMKKQDTKLQTWLSFSLGVARKDKRRRKNLKFKRYFNNLRNDWESILINRGITFDVSNIDETIEMRLFEIDFDSIFNNLLVNSVDAFTLSTINRPREIKINSYMSDKKITIDYFDNGPGLSEDIKEHKKIFEPLYTTKVNEFTGDVEGTGLGMWLVKSIVIENEGKVQLLFPKNGGFGLRIDFPRKYVRR